MALIKLIVTGDMEKAALHESLRRFFPTKKGDGEPVEWDKPQKLHCATSYRLSPPQANQLSNPMKQLAKAMFAAVGIGKTGVPADLVVVIDDVELGNLGQEHIVAAHFRTAVQAELMQYSGQTQIRYQNLLRNKCSYHLLKPMVESYLFGDNNALNSAGVSSNVTPSLLHPSDMEEFETNDHAWLPTCRAENIKRQHNMPWWHHERHPKHYLEHLAARGNVFYEETNHGKKALMQLDWNNVPKVQTDIPVIRALFEDLFNWFGKMNPISGSVHPAFYPAKTVNRNTLLLRNL